MGVGFSSRCLGGSSSALERGGREEAFGHSFRYAPPSLPPPLVAKEAPSSSPSRQRSPPSFKFISGASISANATSHRPTSLLPPAHAGCDGGGGGGFEASSSFRALPLHISDGSHRAPFLSRPIERTSFYGSLNDTGRGREFSGPRTSIRKKHRRRRQGSGGRSALGLLPQSLSERSRGPSIVPVRRSDSDMIAAAVAGSGSACSRVGCVQWAQGKAGEDRVHVVISEEQQWLFVGIYDGFNGHDAAEFLVRNLYRNVFNELVSLFWEEIEVKDGEQEQVGVSEVEQGCDMRTGELQSELFPKSSEECNGDGSSKLDSSISTRIASSLSRLRSGFRDQWLRKGHDDGEAKVKLAGEFTTTDGTGRRRRRVWECQAVDHGVVLDALSRALEITELEYMEMIGAVIDQNPELALMGSCLLVVLIIGEDVYLMNVGDSRAIVARCGPQEAVNDLKGRRSCGDGFDSEVYIDEEIEESTDDQSQALAPALELTALQLSVEHRTSNVEEALRIKEQHSEDSRCIVNGRVKGRLKVTRAFGAGFLKQSKWNNGLLNRFRIEYIGAAPYISSHPSLCHHKLNSSDQFLVISSDGLYQYLTNEEVVSHVKSFMEKFPHGDPAQSLIEEVVLRAAKQAGMDLYELLGIPQGDRRKFHDDVTVMVISLEGRIWRSTGKYL